MTQINKTLVVGASAQNGAKLNESTASVFSKRLPLSVNDFRKLSGSFIDEETATAAGIYRVDSPAGAEIVGQHYKAGKEDFAGMVFPYRLPEDENIRLSRLRRDNPPLEKKTDGTLRENGKYLTPIGAGNYLYFPANSLREWLDDSSLSIIVTEGEKKTLALNRAAWHGLGDAADKPRFLSVGLTGVWNFRGRVDSQSKKKGRNSVIKGMIPDFQLINWRDRTVYILFDSNVATNKNVALARRRFAAQLEELQANILFIDLPETEGCNGIDDVLGKLEREHSESEAVNYLFGLIENATEIDSTLNKSSRFDLRSDGVYGFDNQGREMLICSPLKIIAETHTATGENYGRLLEWHDSKNRRHVWAMPVELLHSNSSEHIKYLAAHGLRIEPSRSHHTQLSNYIAASEPTETRICTDKTGWHRNLFVMPETTVGPETDENVSTVFQSSSGIDHRFYAKGSLDDWRNNVARLCRGNSRLMFAVSTAFAAALLTPLVENGGGFHFRGPSSLGKSTTLLVAGSIWGGDNRRGFLNTWRATANGLESVAELHNDALLCLDELKEADGRTVSESAYMLANGEGKKRMKKSIAAGRSLTWNLLFLSSGELSLSDMVAQTGGRVYGGQEVRMCDIPADAEKGLGLFEQLHESATPELFAKTLQENSREYYGTAILEFLKVVSEDFDSLKAQWTEFRKEFMNDILPAGASGEVQRVASRFALVAFAGCLASDICEWSKEEPPEACKTVFEAWLGQRRNAGQSDMENAVDHVRFFIETHAARFQDLDGLSLSTVQNRVGYRRKNADTNEIEYLVFPLSFRKEICKGFDARTVANELVKRYFLEVSKISKEILKSRTLTMDEMKNSIRVENMPRDMLVINSSIFERSGC